MAQCDNCGVTRTIGQLDAKPQRLAGRRNTMRQLKKALNRNEDFLRNECEHCYGPGYLLGPNEDGRIAEPA